MRWVGPTARPPGASESNGVRDSWEAQLAKLEAYKRSHGDCNVPVTWAKDPRLSKWVRHQRTRKKALDRGEPSERMTAARAAKLDALGFTWAAAMRSAAEQAAAEAAAQGRLQGWRRTDDEESEGEESETE